MTMDSKSPICDFCSGPDPAFEYACTDFVPMQSFDPVKGTTEWLSEGAWLACAACAPLVDAEDWPQLWTCLATRLGEPVRGNPRSFVITQMWRGFAKRRGPKQPLGVTP